MTKHPVVHKAAAIHAKFKVEKDVEAMLTEYDALIAEYPDMLGEILSQRAYSWAWIDEIEKSIIDLRQTVQLFRGGRLASELSHLSRCYLELHQFREAEKALKELEELEIIERSTYFLEYARLMRAYCLARLGCKDEALSQLGAVSEDAEEKWTENIPNVTPALVRDLCSA
jgi:tetratricopeptide (TPR) repeat protein